MRKNRYGPYPQLCILTRMFLLANERNRTQIMFDYLNHDDNMSQLLD